MSSTTQRRKGGGAPFKNTENFKIAVPLDDPAPSITAEVKRYKCGTSPFDENWLNKDCCGLICAFLTYSLHIYGVYTVCLILIPPWMSSLDEDGIRSISFMGQFHRVAFTFVAVLACISHFKAMTTDPGAVPPEAVPLEESNDQNGGSETENSSGQHKRGKRICRRCNTFKPKRAHHCSVCRRCIIKMDHHCPWVNNCVGIGNHKYFLLFIFYTFISCIYSFSLVVTRFFTCMSAHNGHHRAHHLTCLDRPTQLMNILGLIVEAILFGLFTSCMMCDQATVVTSNMTHIDRLKGDAAGTAVAGLIEVFGLNNRKRETADGTRFRPDWLSPFAKVCFPGSLQEEIMGFCVPCRSMGGGETELISSNGAPMVRSIQEII